MIYILVALAGYMLGCSNMAYYICKLKKVDMRNHGSANLGAANTTITLGWRAGILVGLHDIGKAVLAVILAKLLLPNVPYVGAAAGVSCVIGHIFPFWLKFKGGKGFASYIGMTLALNWKFALIVMVIIVLVTLITDYLVMGTLSTIVIVPVYMGISEQDWILPLILLIATAVILYKHRENIPRMINGTEIGLRRTLQKKDRV